MVLRVNHMAGHIKFRTHWQKLLYVKMYAKHLKWHLEENYRIDLISPKKNNTENKWINCLIEEDEKKSYNKAKDRKYIG